MATRNLGRPRRQEARKHVYLFESTLKLWNEHKKEVSGDDPVMTNNEFALFLLNQLAVKQTHSKADFFVQEHNYFDQGIMRPKEGQKSR